MAKTYIPSFVVDNHRQAVFIARYGSILRAAIAAISPEAALAYDTVTEAILAFDAFAQTLYPLGS